MEEIINVAGVPHYLMFFDSAGWRYAYYVDITLKSTYFVGKALST